MSPEKTKQLQEAFPEYFKCLDEKPRRTGLYFGIENSDGWYDLIYKLCEDIKKIDPKDFYWVQIKEKFGLGRFYASGGNKETYDLIDKAERKSAFICEDCGQDGCTRHRNGWLRTLCDQCAESRSGEGATYIKLETNEEDDD